MTALSFVCVARDAGRAVWDLYTDLAQVCETGDQVIWIDDSGPNSETGRWLNRFAAMQAWPQDVARQTVVAGTRGLGDAGIAINLGLRLATSDVVLVLDGRTRLYPAGIAAARAASAQADVVICPWDTQEARAPRLTNIMFRRALLADGPALRCDEAVAGWSDLNLVEGVLARAARTAEVSLPLGTRTPHAPDAMGLFEATTRLCTHRPQAAPWIMAHLPGWLRGAGSGAVTGALEHAAVWVANLHDLPAGEGAGFALAAALQCGDAARARTYMRQMCLPATQPCAPPCVGSAPMRIWLNGPHTRRTPFAYPALAALWADRIEICDTPQKADLAVWAHPLDLLDLTKETAESLEQSRIPAALISEEPFWDSIFSPDPLADKVTLRAAHLGGLTLHQTNHHRSPIFDFTAIPYFLLTDPRFIETYRRLFARNAARSVETWIEDFTRRQGRTVFMAERRPETFHDIALPQGDLLGLCAWRTRLAETYATGTVERIGSSWQGGPTRFDMPDWHQDKITRLDGRAGVISALENTHQPTYISEKLFDAFACGARPLYLASLGHRVHDLGLPDAAWINLWGMDSAAAALAIDAAPPFPEIAAQYVQAQSTLAALFCDEATVARERTRLTRAVTGEVARLIDLGPA